MLNVLDFIDSKTIREYNKDHKFSPFEMAIIADWSHKCPVIEKIDFMSNLLKEYPDEHDFRYVTEDGKSIDTISMSPLRTEVLNCIASYMRAIELKSAKDKKHVFIAYTGINGDDFIDRKVFTTYDKAESFIMEKAEKWSKISVEAVDSPDSDDECCFIFDSNFNTVDINYNIDYSSSFYDSLKRMFFINIPNPFRKGDIVKWSTEGSAKYGIISNDLDEVYFKKEFEKAIEFGTLDSGTNAIVNVDYAIRDNNGGIRFLYDHVSIFDLELVDADELKGKKYKELQCIRSMYKGELSIEDFLFIVSQPYIEGVDENSLMDAYCI